MLIFILMYERRDTIYRNSVFLQLQIIISTYQDQGDNFGLIVQMFKNNN